MLLIAEVKQSHSLREISGVIKIHGPTRNYYRIRIGDYRVGFVQEENTIFLFGAFIEKIFTKYFPKRNYLPFFNTTQRFPRLGACVEMRKPGRIPVFAMSEEFDVKWYGKY